MVLGLSKGFVIALFIGIFFWIGMKDYMSFIWIILAYAIVKVIWRFATN